MERSISFTFRKARVKTSILTWIAGDLKETWTVTGPGPVAGFGNSIAAPVPVGVGVVVKVAVGVIVEVADAVGVGLGVGVAIAIVMVAPMKGSPLNWTAWPFVPAAADILNW